MCLAHSVLISFFSYRSIKLKCQNRSTQGRNFWTSLSGVFSLFHRKSKRFNVDCDYRGHSGGLAVNDVQDMYLTGHCWEKERLVLLFQSLWRHMKWTKGLPTVEQSLTGGGKITVWMDCCRKPVTSFPPLLQDALFFFKQALQSCHTSPEGLEAPACLFSCWLGKWNGGSY